MNRDDHSHRLRFERWLWSSLHGDERSSFPISESTPDSMAHTDCPKDIFKPLKGENWSDKVEHIFFVRWLKQFVRLHLMRQGLGEVSRLAPPARVVVVFSCL